MSSCRFVHQTLCLILLGVVSLALGVEDSLDSIDSKSPHLIPVSRLKEIADYVNAEETTWKAEVNPEWLRDDATLLDLSHLTGTFDPKSTPKELLLDSIPQRKNISNGADEANEDDDDGDDDDDDESESDEESGENSKKDKETEKSVQCEDNGLPKEFDSRKKWPKCKSLSHIYDQGNCGSCWAVSAVSAFTDRVCIQTNGKHTELRSAQQVLSCCHKGAAKDGCKGGWPEAAFDYIRRNGLSTGGDYNSKTGCQPYRIQPCAHHLNGTKLRSCTSYKGETAHKCKLHCYNREYGVSFKKDRIKIKKVYEVDPCAAMNEIYRRGPIVAAFAAYEDFFLYKSGIYQYTKGVLKGWHAVRVIGWGVEKGTPYWLATNSWNSDWGEKGYFRILRGSPGNGWFDENFVACTIDH